MSQGKLMEINEEKTQFQDIETKSIRKKSITKTQSNSTSRQNKNLLLGTDANGNLIRDFDVNKPIHVFKLKEPQFDQSTSTFNFIDTGYEIHLLGNIYQLPKRLNGLILDLMEFLRKEGSKKISDTWDILVLEDGRKIKRSLLLFNHLVTTYQIKTKRGKKNKF